MELLNHDHDVSLRFARIRILAAKRLHIRTWDLRFILVYNCRNEGYGGRLVLLSTEDVLPYDRPKLSKKLDAGPGELQLRDEQWFKAGTFNVVILFIRVYTLNKFEISLNNFYL